MYTLYCITDLYSFVRANGLTNKLIRIRIRPLMLYRVCYHGLWTMIIVALKKLHNRALASPSSYNVHVILDTCCVP